MARIFPFPQNPEFITKRIQSTTFRKGWTHLTVGEPLTPVAEEIGALAPGKKYTPLLPKGHILEVLQLDFVAIQDISRLDVDRCGFKNVGVDTYQKFLMQKYDCGLLDVMTRIYFGYLQPRQSVMVPQSGLILPDANMTVYPANKGPDRG